jgi:hypothetical protein
LGKQNSPGNRQSHEPEQEPAKLHLNQPPKTNFEQMALLEGKHKANKTACSAQYRWAVHEKWTALLL